LYQITINSKVAQYLDRRDFSHTSYEARTVWKIK